MVLQTSVLNLLLDELVVGAAEFSIELIVAVSGAESILGRRVVEARAIQLVVLWACRGCLSSISEASYITCCGTSITVWRDWCLRSFNWSWCSLICSWDLVLGILGYDGADFCRCQHSIYEKVFDYFWVMCVEELAQRLVYLSIYLRKNFVNKLLLAMNRCHKVVHRDVICLNFVDNLLEVLAPVNPWRREHLVRISHWRCQLWCSKVGRPPSKLRARRLLHWQLWRSLLDSNSSAWVAWPSWTRSMQSSLGVRAHALVKWTHWKARFISMVCPILAGACTIGATLFARLEYLVCAVQSGDKLLEVFLHSLSLVLDVFFTCLEGLLQLNHRAGVVLSTPLKLGKISLKLWDQLGVASLVSSRGWTICWTKCLGH